MEYTIKHLSNIAGVSARTLRYYDEIDLLKPCRINSSGYRIYGAKEVSLLQQILFFRELGLELQQIKDIVHDKNFNRLHALNDHLVTLQERQTQINLLIENVKKTILEEKGKIKMTDKEKFEGFKKKLIEENEVKYGEEIRGKYDDADIKESYARMMNLSEEEFNNMQTLEISIREALEQAVQNKVSPESEEGKKIASMHKEWLSFNWKQYNKEAHKNLADMYLADSRFTAYYDGKIAGCAAFLKDAIYAYCM